LFLGGGKRDKKRGKGTCAEDNEWKVFIKGGKERKESVVKHNLAKRCKGRNKPVKMGI